MHGLVSLLDKEHYALVEEIWQELEGDCGLRGIHVTPLPHFSWQIAEDYDWDALKIALGELVAGIQPFTIYTGGLALFTGESPVVYIPVVRTRQLSELHEIIWERLTPLSRAPSLYYAPDFWMPHISLAYNDIDPQKLTCLMEKLAFRAFHWEIEIDNLTLIYEPAGTIGQIRYRFQLGAKEIDKLSGQ